MSDLIDRQVAVEAILEDKIDSKTLELMRVFGDGMQAQTFNDTCDRHAQIIKTLPSARPTQNNDSNVLKALDCIDRQAAIDALWKALHEYEDKTAKQFQESEDLDVGDWMLHRIFVQNLSDLDRQTILNLPAVQVVR